MVVYGATKTEAMEKLAAVGELLGLTWDGIDVVKGTLVVRKILAQAKAGFVLKEPKTLSSRRTIHLPMFAIVALSAH